MVARAGKALAVVSLLATILAVELVSHTSPVSPSAAHADVRHVGHGYVAAAHVVRAAGRNDLDGAGVCPLAVRSTGYVNPLAKAKVKSERIDQGVDYAGSGTLIAIGAARVTHLATDGSGWPGAFIEYRLLNGPDAGCYVYYAEGVTPEPGLHVGATIGAGQPVATIIPQYQTGFEIGWGAGSDTKTYTAAHGKWTANDDQDNVASGPGQNFSALIAALGGPPGKVEG